MFGISYEVTGFDEFVERTTHSNFADRAERDQIIAAKYPELDRVLLAGEPYGKLWVDTGDERMETAVYGATVALLELDSSVVALQEGSGSFEAWYLSGGYGLPMLFERVDDRLVVTRKERGKLDRRAVETSWSEFTSAVDQYEEWYHTEYLTQASWLLQLEEVQELRQDAGYRAESA